MKKNNTSKFWDQKIETECKNISLSPIFQAKNRIVVNWLSNLKGRLLNIGIGYGILETQLRRFNNEIKLYGIDISKKAVVWAETNVKGKFYLANTTKIPFPVNFFDCILALDVLEHLTKLNLEKAIKEIRKVLKEGGIFIVSVPLNEIDADFIANRHTIHFTEKSIKCFLEDKGFKILNKKLLYAFKNLYTLKTIVARVFRIKKPNLIILKSKKL